MLTRCKTLTWSGKKANEHRRSVWITIEVSQDEIATFPKDVHNELCKKVKENCDMEEKIEELHEAMVFLASQDKRKRKSYVDVGERQQRRLRKEILDKASTALKFAELYGLTPKTVLLEDNETTSTLQVDLSDDKDKPSETQSETPKLDKDDKLKVETLLYIMDRFSISLKGYHEISQHDTALPRTYLIEKCAKEINEHYNITRTPGICPGAELSFKFLLEKEIARYLETGGTKKKIKVKLSGDGAKMSHTSNLFVLSFSLPEMEGQNILSSFANHTIALVMGNEDYNTLKTSLANAIKEVNGLIAENKIKVKDSEFELEFFLGGDYKFLLNAMGMKAATSDNSCIWCEINKKERCNMSHVCSYRKLEKDWYKNPGCEDQPLFNIPLDHIVIDELHLLLRVMDRLEEGLIKDVIAWDKDEGTTNANMLKGKHLTELCKTIHSIGVSFELWINKAKEIEWTALLGSEKRKLLQKLPTYFEKCLPAGKVERTRKLWVNFCHLLDKLNTENTAEDVDLFEKEALQWGKDMVDMSGRGPGYMQTVIITPYMHTLVFHIPQMLRQYGSLKFFSGQGVEKKNDDYRRYFHQKINRWDTTTQLLQVEKRQEELRHLERVKRAYSKENNQFWNGGGKQQAASKFPRISKEKNNQPAIFTRQQLKTKKTNELLQLLKDSGLVISNKTRKDVLIDRIIERQQ